MFSRATVTMAVPMVILAFALHKLISNQSEICRCSPSSSCWPSPDDWRLLNESLHGSLTRLRPVGYVCSKYEFSQEACEDVMKNSMNTTWRVLHPAALQVVTWEYARDKEESCHVKESSTPTVTCAQGRVPEYSARLSSIQHIQQVVQFASSKNIRISIRNTGHDVAGRSTAPGALQLDTSGLKEIQYTDSFYPQHPRVGEAESEPEGAGPAVTVGAGVLFGELYAHAAKHGYTVVGGSCSTVGVAGGWMQGGGYGILSPLLGLGSDNVIELTIVTADGRHVTANQHQNQDLFWAVRGGGGGTFGVVTSVVFRAYRDASLKAFRINVSSSAGPDAAFWTAFESLFRDLPGLLDAGVSLQAYGFPVPFPPTAGGTATAAASIMIEALLVNQTNGGALQTLRGLGTRLEAELGLEVQTSDETWPTLSSFLATPRGLDQAGLGAMTASRLVSRRVTTSPSGPSELAGKLSRMLFNPGDVLSVEAMLGGQVAANKALVESALHPAWRESLFSLTFARALPAQADWNYYQAAEDQVRQGHQAILRGLENDTMPGYLNTAFAYEENPARAFWGPNYKGLLEVKSRWDPDGLFITRLGVGSEEWDSEGFCRLGRTWARRAWQQARYRFLPLITQG